MILVAKMLLGYVQRCRWCEKINHCVERTHINVKLEAFNNCLRMCDIGYYNASGACSTSQVVRKQVVMDGKRPIKWLNEVSFGCFLIVFCQFITVMLANTWACAHKNPNLHSYSPSPLPCG